MTQGVKDLINAIAEGDASSINAAFNAEMATRISSRLEDLRVQVAQGMFKSPVAEEVAEEPQQEEAAEEVSEETEEQIEEVSEETEEIEEESEQLDELSPKTLGSYHKKARLDADKRAGDLNWQYGIHHSRDVNDAASEDEWDSDMKRHVKGEIKHMNRRTKGMDLAVKKLVKKASAK